MFYETYFSLNRANTQTYIWDVKDLENPQLKNVHFSPHEAIDHNQYTLNGFAYQSNYAAG
jgi:hypothetical protein